MKNKILTILCVICISFLGGCEKMNSQLCGGSNPMNDLSWLKQEINRLSTSPNCNSISRSTYKEQTVYIFSNCEPNVNSIPFLYNCDGVKLELSPSDYQALNFTGNIELIWKSK